MSSDGRTVSLADGRTLTVRAVEPADADGLCALYAGLDQQASYRRFFSTFRPDPEFFGEMATIADRGGFGVVAALADGTGAEELVAEASYTLLPGGDGELAITVAERWRGWLGPFLFDALLAEAAAQGVPNIQADILVTNSPMLALVRSRGYATLDHPDGAVLRVVIGTSGPTPTWSDPHERPRVLVEAPGGRWHAEEAARAAGLQVLVCPGPGAAGSRCPALRGQTCPLAADADAIVVSHARHDDRWLALPDAHAHLHPGVPVCVELAPSDEAEGGELVVPRGDKSEVVAFVQRLARSTMRSATTNGTIDPSARA
jgi:hypothetical protein